MYILSKINVLPLRNYTSQCISKEFVEVQVKLSCLVSLLIASKNELPSNDVSISSNLFFLNRIDGTSCLCLFSEYGDCGAGVNTSSPVKPVLVTQNAFVRDLIANSTPFSGAYPPVLHKFVEVFGLDDFLNMSANWWSTLNPADVSSKVNSYAQIYNYGPLYKSEQRMLTLVPNIFGMRSPLCNNEWLEYEQKCFFRVASALNYSVAGQVCASLNSSIAQYSSEVISFAAKSFNATVLWLRNGTCVDLKTSQTKNVYAWVPLAP